MIFTSVIGIILTLDMIFSILDNNLSRAITDFSLLIIVFLTFLVFKKLGKIDENSFFDNKK